MTPLEIALLALGALVFVLSFVIPVKKKETSGEIREMIEDEVKLKVKGEIDELRSHIDDVVDEAIDYAQEKTERSLERISNEKIMAVNEYSDTVLSEIDKNHKEVMFLYDMLSDKHEDLKSTVSEAAVVAKEVKEKAEAAEAAAEAASESTSKAEAAISGFKSFTAESIPAVTPVPVPRFEPVERKEAVSSEKSEKETSEPKFRTLKWAEFALEQADEAYSRENGEAKDETIVKSSGSEAIPGAVENSEDETKDQRRDQVIALHKLGKTDVEIARALDMGVGEVSLIIGLHAK